ncbi:MAG TPA: hypothetical protein VGT79_02780 [Xanthomonadaceae bacterium]|nr:hypothetical protein [Xanthomonadaceae bacterium]
MTAQLVDPVFQTLDSGLTSYAVESRFTVGGTEKLHNCEAGQ